MDVFDKEKRSAVMGRIRSSGTLIERRLHELARAALGPKRRIDRNVRTLPGSPDLVVPSLRIAMFSDGCFFHGCPKHGRVPGSNADYWRPKLARNARRDRRNARALRALGFAVWRLWEHDLESKAACERTLRRLRQRFARRMIL